MSLQQEVCTRDATEDRELCTTSLRSQAAKVSKADAAGSRAGNAVKVLPSELHIMSNFNLMQQANGRQHMVIGHIAGVQ
ncbi:unnamed protein product, partial [Symbiodinium sp. CCMP2592]